MAVSSGFMHLDGPPGGVCPSRCRECLEYVHGMAWHGIAWHGPPNAARVLYMTGETLGKRSQ